MGEFLAYALFLVLIVAALRYVMAGIEPDVPAAKRPDPEQ